MNLQEFSSFVSKDNERFLGKISKDVGQAAAHTKPLLYETKVRTFTRKEFTEDYLAAQDYLRNLCSWMRLRPKNLKTSLTQEPQLTYSVLRFEITP